MFKDNYAGVFLKYWGAWMSGVASVIFGVWVLFFEPRSETVKSAFTWFAIVGAVATFYQLWAIEHKKYLKEKEKNERYKVIFEIDEVTTRVFIQATSEDSLLISTNLKLRFENVDTHNWNIKSISVTLHKLEAPQEDSLLTWIVTDRYFGLNDAEIPRHSFEGMMIQAGRLTEWYRCMFSLSGVQGVLNRPDELTASHFLRVTMKASNQNLFHCDMFIDWKRALTEQGAPVLSFGAPAIRNWENRRLGD